MRCESEQRFRATFNSAVGVPAMRQADGGHWSAKKAGSIWVYTQSDY